MKRKVWTQRPIPRCLYPTFSSSYQGASIDGSRKEPGQGPHPRGTESQDKGGNQEQVGSSGSSKTEGILFADQNLPKNTCS